MTFEFDVDMNPRQIKDFLRLIGEGKLTSYSTTALVPIFMQIFGKEIPVPVADGELSEWVERVRTMLPSKTDSSTRRNIQTDFEKFLEEAVKPEGLMSVVHELYPEETWKKGVSLARVTDHLLQKLEIELPVQVPPPAQQVRAIQVLARCFSILKQSAFELIDQARNGDKNAVLSLVRMDKLFLHDSCTRAVITAAERSVDTTFLNQLSGAIRRGRRKIQRSQFVLYCFCYLRGISTFRNTLNCKIRWILTEQSFQARMRLKNSWNVADSNSTV